MDEEKEDKSKKTTISPAKLPSLPDESDKNEKTASSGLPSFGEDEDKAVTKKDDEFKTDSDNDSTTHHQDEDDEEDDAIIAQESHRQRSESIANNVDSVEHKQDTVVSEEQETSSDHQMTDDAQGLTPEEIEEGWEIDDRTGMKYKKIAKQKFSGTKKQPVPFRDDSVLKEIDDPYDVNDSSVKFLSHLQVPPDEEEMRQIRAERAAARKVKNAKYKEMALSLSEDNTEDEQTEEESPGKSSFLSKLFGGRTK